MDDDLMKDNIYKSQWKDSRCAGNPPAPGAGGLPALRSFSSGEQNDSEVYWLTTIVSVRQ